MLVYMRNLNRKVVNYILLIALFFISQLAGCGCENKYALRASKGELIESSKLMDEAADIIDYLDMNFDNLTISVMYDKKREIEKKFSRVKFILYWSKNIDQVLDNDFIKSELRMQKARFQDLVDEFEEIQLDFAQKIGEERPEKVVPGYDEEYDEVDDSEEER